MHLKGGRRPGRFKWMEVKCVFNKDLKGNLHNTRRESAKVQNRHHSFCSSVLLFKFDYSFDYYSRKLRKACRGAGGEAKSWPDSDRWTEIIRRAKRPHNPKRKEHVCMKKDNHFWGREREREIACDLNTTYLLSAIMHHPFGILEHLLSPELEEVVRVRVEFQPVFAILSVE